MLKKTNKIPILAICGISVIYSLYLYHGLENIPREDDYWFLMDFKDFISQSIGYQINKLFVVHNSHNSMPAYLLGAIQMYFTNSIDLRIQLVFSWILLGFIIFIIFKLFKGVNVLYFLPILLLLLNPISFRTIFFPLNSFQYLSLFFFCAVCLYCLIFKNLHHFYLTIPSAIFCSLSFGSGIIIWPLGIFILLILKKYHYLILWIFCSAIFIIIFSLTFKNQGVINLFHITDYLPSFFTFIIVFPGNALDLFPNLVLSKFSQLSWNYKALFILKTILIVGFSGFSFLFILKSIFSNLVAYKNGLNSNDKKILFAICLFLFVFGSGLLAGYFRANFGFQAANTSRYKFFGQMALTSMYILFFFTFQTRYFKNILKLSVLYYFIIWIFYFPESVNNKTFYLASNINIQNGESPYVYLNYENNLEGFIHRKIIPHIKKQEIFDFNKNSFSTIQKTSLAFIKNGPLVNDLIEIENDKLFITLDDYNYYDSYLLIFKKENSILTIPLFSRPFLSFPKDRTFTHSAVYHPILSNYSKIYLIKL